MVRPGKPGCPSDGLLAPYRVLDLSDENGLFCGRILGDLGADVIKIERPGGDRCRRIGPFYGDIPEPEKSLFWFAYCANKRGITLNIETTVGALIFKRLVRTADIVVETFRPGYLDGLGLGYSDLSLIRPSIVLTSITPFGQTGPYEGFKGPDLVTWSMGGMSLLSGDPDRPPVRVSFPQSCLHGGAAGAAASVFALFVAGSTGRGQHADVSIQEQVVHSLMNARQFWDVSGVNLRRAGQFRTGLSTRSDQRLIWRCLDGFVNFAVMGGATGARTNRAVAEWMRSEGKGDEYLDSMDWPRFDMALATEEQLSRIAVPIAEFFKAHAMAELMDGAVKRGIMLYPVYSAAEIVSDPQLADREFWRSLDHPELGRELTYPGPFANLRGVPCFLRRRAPLVGEHNVEIYGEIGICGAELVRLREDGVV